jgi:hypothetical protein
MSQDKTATTAKEESGKIDRRSMPGFAAASLAGTLLTSSMSGESHQTSAPAPRRRRFKSKVIAITGATSAIGRAAALQFAAEGAQVSFCGPMRSSVKRLRVRSNYAAEKVFTCGLMCAMKPNCKPSSIKPTLNVPWDHRQRAGAESCGHGTCDRCGPEADGKAVGEVSCTGAGQI